MKRFSTGTSKNWTMRRTSVFLTLTEGHLKLVNKHLIAMETVQISTCFRHMGSH